MIHLARCLRCSKSGMVLKVNSDGLCMDCLTAALKESEKERKSLQDRITPEFEEAERIPGILAQRRKELSVIEDKLASAQSKYQALQASLLTVEDAVELESFALYIPRFEFATSEQYKTRLSDVRSSQKQMLRDKSAVIYDENLTYNGSKAQGKKLLADMAKLCVRSFNNECDAAVNEVKFSNFDRCKERILKAFEEINNLGKTNKMSLSFQYRQLKLDELALAHEYQCKKEEERESIRTLRAQQREEAKLAKEIAEARKEAEKERKHYLQALEKLKQQAVTAGTEEERSAIVEKQNELIGRLDDLNQKMEDIDYRQSNQRAGYVYIISNIGSFGEGIYKIGMTRRLDPMERVYELGDASVPFIFDIHAMIFSDDAPKLEAALHQAFADKRVNLVNKRREYFRVSLDEIKEVVRANHDKTVEFTDVPSAWQYRETQLMR